VTRQISTKWFRSQCESADPLNHRREATLAQLHNPLPQLRVEGMARGACLAVRLKLSRAGPSCASYETCNDHVRDRRPCRLCRPGAGLRRARCPAGSGARGDRAASRRDDVHARQWRSARSARRRKPQPPAIASATPWRYTRAERRTERARSVAAGTMAREAFASRRTPRDRGRRSDRRAGGEDGRRPDSPHGRGRSGKGGPLAPAGAPLGQGLRTSFPRTRSGLILKSTGWEKVR
jgi:hypothetical protein